MMRQQYGSSHRAAHRSFRLLVMLPTLVASRLRRASIAGRPPPARAGLPSPAFVAGLRRHPTGRRRVHGSRALRLNRILFDASEIDGDGGVVGPPPADDAAGGGGTAGVAERPRAPLATVTLPRDDYRTIHVAKVLGLRNGDTLRAGAVRGPDAEEGRDDGGDRHRLLAGLITDDATVEWLPEGKIKKAQPTKNGDPPGSLRLSIPAPPLTSLWGGRDRADDDGGAAPPVSLLLALPRPLQLGRILPAVAQLGVDRLILTNARKVPKDYFGSHVFRRPGALRDLLVEGLAQSGDVRLPDVTVARRLKVFLEDELDDLFPEGEVARVVAHPRRKGANVIATTHGNGREAEGHGAKRMSDVKFPFGGPKRIVVAVGPEGGWEEPHELDMFADKGFQQITMGTRVLRSDVAVVGLLALAHEICAADSS